MASNDARVKTSAIKRLRRLFAEKGWMHSAPDPRRRRTRPLRYKRGFEARLSVSPDEAPAVLRLLAEAGFEPGKPFAKGRMLRVPIYGKAQIQRLRSMLGRA